MTAPAQTKSTVKRRAYWRWFLALLLFLLLLMIWVDSNGVAPPTVVNPECDHYHEVVLALPGPITNVPEYHDCQRLINSDGTTYGPLVGVFARNALGDVVINADTGVMFTYDPGPGGSVVPGSIIPVHTKVTIERTRRAKMVAIGEIKSYDKPYPALGIEPGLNCLYIVKVQPLVGGPYQYQALMISNVTDDAVCLNPPATGGKWLPVSYTPPTTTDPRYPPVARWDWDTGHSLHGISILCATDWCDVGPPGMTATAAHSVNLGSPVLDAPWEHKGRYDEQPLAIAEGAGLKPSGAVASAFPHEALGGYDDDSFKHFVPVARTVLPDAIAEYQTKFNFRRGSIPSGTNDVSMCAGWRFKCMGLRGAIATFFSVRCWKSDDGKIWWAKIVGSDSSTEYRCVTRRTQGMVNVPATARWRWKANDEGLWTRCAAGCCEVYADE